ncbi:hypothetical protein P4W15_13730 [Morganella morganii]|nr:hypothetical protein [Morganella morganii]
MNWPEPLHSSGLILRRCCGIFTPGCRGELPGITDAPESDETLLSRHEKIIAAIDEVKQCWRESDADFVSLIQNSDLNKSSYRANLVPGWIAGIDDWAKETETTHYALPKNIERFSQAVLDEKTKKRRYAAVTSGVLCD